MNKLNLEKQAQIIKVLCEGNSIRATSRITGAAVNTVVKLLREVGAVCLDYQDRAMHNLPCKKLQCDELWSFCYSKQKNVPEDKKGQFGYGDVWTWTALDADTKLVPSWLVGSRDAGFAMDFMNDLKSRAIIYLTDPILCANIIMHRRLGGISKCCQYSNLLSKCLNTSRPSNLVLTT
jgi:hypothetical protein